MHYIHKPKVKHTIVMTVCGLPTTGLPGGHSWTGNNDKVNCPFCENELPFADEEGLDELLGKSEPVKLHENNLGDHKNNLANVIEEEAPSVIYPSLENELKNLISADKVREICEKNLAVKKEEIEIKKRRVVSYVNRKIRESIKWSTKDINIEMYHPEDEYHSFLKDFYEFLMEVLADKGFDASFCPSSYHDDPVKILIRIKLKDEK